MKGKIEMRKVTAIVIYDSTKNNLYNLTLSTKDCNLITLVEQEDDTDIYHFDTFFKLHEYVLRLLKINGFYVKSWPIFGSNLYDICFIDTSDKSNKIHRLLHNDGR